MMLSCLSSQRLILAGALAVQLGAGCGVPAPTEDVLSVRGSFNGPTGLVDVDFSDGGSRGEWWPCDGRLTAQACVGDAHVNVFLGLPVFRELSELGGDRCVFDGVASGAFEILERKFDNNQDAKVPDDVSAFVLVGSDADGDGFVETNDGDETVAAGRILSGDITLFSLTGFDAPLALHLVGSTDAGTSIDVTFLGPMTVPAVVPALEGPDTCE